MAGLVTKIKNKRFDNHYYYTPRELTFTADPKIILKLISETGNMSISIPINRIWLPMCMFHTEI